MGTPWLLYGTGAVAAQSGAIAVREGVPLIVSGRISRSLVGVRVEKAYPHVCGADYGRCTRPGP